MKLFIVLLASLQAFANNVDYTTDIKALKFGEHKSDPKFEIVTAEETKAVPADNGGNYGDLVFASRQNGDVLLLRDVFINPQLSSVEQDFQWYTTIPNARRISTVRALNFGRQRAYTMEIGVAANEAQVILRIPAYYDPRVIIEVYGF